MARSTCSLLLIAGLLGSCGPPSDRTVIQNKGSDTLVNVAQSWAEVYHQSNPNVAVAVTGGGSGTGIAALINGTVDIANASRKLSPDEFQTAKRAGNDPVEFVVGYDALAVYVHPNNPLDSVTLEQLAEVYGENGTIESWTQLGVQVEGCRDQEIVRVSRQNNSGTYEYFREAVLGNMREYKLGSRDMHGSKDVVDLVQNTPCAIGYSGLAYLTPRVKALCVARSESDECISPTVQTAVDGSYPIARPLFMYTAGEPEGAVREYLDWILSDEGQCIIFDRGYAPATDVSCEPRQDGGSN